MARPAFPNAFSSGWHLHRSLRSADADNVFAALDGELPSETVRACMAGLLAHALARWHLIMLKQHESRLFRAAVTDWEHREYLEMH